MTEEKTQTPVTPVEPTEKLVVEPTVTPTEQLTAEVKPVVTETKPSLPLDMEQINKDFEAKLQTIQAQYEQKLVERTTELDNSYTEKFTQLEEKLNEKNGRKGVILPTPVPEPITTPQEQVPKRMTVDEVRNIRLTPVQEAEAAQAFLDSVRK